MATLFITFLVTLFCVSAFANSAMTGAKQSFLRAVGLHGDDNIKQTAMAIDYKKIPGVATGDLVLTAASTPTSYVVLTSCTYLGGLSNNAPVQQAVPIGSCFTYTSAFGGPYYGTYTVNNNVLTYNSYSAAGCASANLVSSTVQASVGTSCSSAGGVTWTISSTSSNLPATPTAVGGVIEQLFLDTGCATAIGWNYYPFYTCVLNSALQAYWIPSCASTSSANINTYPSLICSTASASANSNWNLMSTCTAGQPASSGYSWEASDLWANSASGIGSIAYTQTCYTPPSSSSSSSSCFAGSESVMLASGESKSIADVQIGDKVLAFSSAEQKTVFSDVVAVPHTKNDVAADFQHIVLADGADIKLTAEHLLPAGDCAASSLPLKRAADVKVGECVQTTTQSVSVVSNTVVAGSGVYTIVTEKADYVVVNGIVASPFAVNHAIANFVYGIHRAVYAVAPKLVGPVAGIMANLAAYFTK